MFIKFFYQLVYDILFMCKFWLIAKEKAISNYLKVRPIIILAFLFNNISRILDN
jgi:hypothetical protein